MPINFGHISGAEPSTVTFKAATVTQTINSSVMHKEVITIGDPQSSIGIATVLASAPASTEFGLTVRQVGFVAFSTNVTIAGNSTVSINGPVSTAAPSATDTGVIVRQVGYSTIVSVANTVTIQGNSSVVIASGNSSVIVTSGNSSVIVTSGNSSVIVTSGNLTSTCIQGTNPWTIAGNSTVVFAQGHLATSAPSSGSSGLVVREIYDLRITVASSNAFTSTSFAVQTSAAAIATYVTAYTITSTVAAATKIAFYDGATLIWPIQLQAVSSAVSGANLSGYPYLFKGSAAAGMTLQTPSSVAGVRVGVSYYRAP